MKKLVHFLLVILLCSMLAVPVFANEPGTEEPVSYILNNRNLTISGSGEIPFQTFALRKDIFSVSIENGITDIGYGAFYSCPNIEAVSLPSSLTCIKGTAFADCNSLESIDIPDSVTTLGAGAFVLCNNLSHAKISANLQILTETVFQDSGLTEVSIPSSVRKIERYAFRGCKRLKSVSMVEGVTEIGESAFANCGVLSEIELPRSVTSIGESAFSDDTALTATIHRTGDIQISDNAFQNVAKLIVLVSKDWTGDHNTFGAKSVVYVMDGDGTAETPYLISTSGQLAQLAKEVSNGTTYEGKYFKLTKDITYSGAPIGKRDEGPFKGIFDGDGHTLTVNISTGDSYAALFSDAIGATIKNLEIKGTISGTDSVGGVVGLARDNTLINNCYVSASVTGSELNIGGIVGVLYNGSTVSNCRVDGMVKGRSITIGGIVGWLHNSCRVINCVKTGDTIGDSAVGGIVGYVSQGNSAIINCASFGTVTASSSCGGIIGLIKEYDETFNDTLESLKLYACYANCNIVSNTDHGYICGRNEHDNTSPVDAKELYYAVTGYENALGYQPPAATEVICKNKTSVLIDLNAFAADYGDAALTAWSEVGSGFCPASCQGYFDAAESWEIPGGYKHNFTAYSVTTEATCISPGVETAKCADCGETVTREISIDPNAHSFGEYTLTTKATCTTKGLETAVCACGKTVTREISIDPNAHIFREYSVITKATCTTKGVKTVKCANCNATDEQEIPIDPNAHSFGEYTVTTKATCTTKGVKTAKCADCNAIDKQEIPIDPNAHSFGKYTVTTKATCMTPGVETAVCACGKTVTREIPIDPNAHSWKISFFKYKCACGATKNLLGSGSTLSEGNIWIVAGIAGAAVIGVSTLVIVKKKKPIVTASETEEE